MAERIKETEVNDNIVWVDGRWPHRWLDAVGPDVVKWIEPFVHFPVDDTSGNPTAWTTTEAGTNTIALVAGADTGRVVITTGTSENNGLQTQLCGEAFKLEKSYPFYLGFKFAISDVDQVDALLGLCITDTSLIAGLSYGIHFRTVDEDATMYAVIEGNSLETAVANYTLSDATYVTAEMQYDGDTLTVYMNGIEVASISDQDANWPSAEYLTPSLAILTGANVASTLTVEWARVILIRN